MEPKKIETKELFTTFCVGVGAIAAAPKAGEVIRDIVNWTKNK